MKTLNRKIESVNKILTNLESQNVSETLIIGDLNFDLQDELDSHKLIDFNAVNNFTNVINKPTRLDPVSGKMTLLDVILCSNPTSVLSSDVFPYSRSDHWLIVSIFNFKSSKYKYCSIPSRCFKREKNETAKAGITIPELRFKQDYCQHSLESNKRRNHEVS